MGIIKTVLLYIFIAITGYLAIGYLFHLVIFPEKKPDVSTYFKAGDILYSKSEGFLQTVTRQENGSVYCTLAIEPFAEGPPKHIHTGFEEYFEPLNGEISVWVNDEVRKVKPGEKITIPKGVPHAFYNESADTLHLKSEYAFPEEFAFYLNQVYGYMDETPDFGKMPTTLFQMSMFQTRGFDSYIAEGPPVFIQKTAGFFVVPLARLLGYQSYSDKYTPQRLPQM